MNMYLIAVHYDNKKNILGFRIFDSDTSEVCNQPYANVLGAITKGFKIQGLKYDKSSGKLKGSNGSIDRYPKLVDNRLVEDSFIILENLENIGYKMCDFKGEVHFIKNNELIKAGKSINIANGKIVSKDDGSTYISSINGNYIIGKAPDIWKKVDYKKEVDNNMRDLERTSTVKAPTLINRRTDPRFAPFACQVKRSDSQMKALDEATSLTVEQKLAYTSLALKEVRPFYHCVFNSLRPIEADPVSVQTMGVSIDKLYFSADFVKETPLPDLLFIYMHEVLHIAMMHAIRKDNREHDLWNVACDYYINSLLASEFGLQNKGDVVRVNGNGNRQFKIGLPINCLYNANVDVKKDIPEKLYEEIKSEMHKQQQQDQDSQGQQGQQGQQDQQGQGQQGQQDQGQGQGQGQQSQQEQEQGQQEQGQEQGQGQGQQEQDQNSQGQGQGQGQGQKEQEQQGQKEADQCGTQNQQENSEGQDDQNSQSQNEQGQSQKEQDRLKNVTFRGEKIGNTNSDIVDDTNDSATEKANKAKAILKRAQTIYKKMGKPGGHSDHSLSELVDEELAPVVNWVSVLNNKLNKISQSISTYSAPDKRFRSRGIIIPGPKQLENTELENIKICIDTSGSMSREDLGRCFNQVRQLLRRYKADAELIYWDTAVRATYKFKNIREVIDKPVDGGGGTDINCLFRYFCENDDYKKRRKPKPSIIVIFTDGYVGTLREEYYKYCRDLIWVIHDNNSFVAPVGKVAPLRN